MSNFQSSIPVERSYDAEMLRVMGSAFDMVHRLQPLVGSERIALAIIGFAKKGQDAESLCAEVRDHLRNRI